LNQSVGKEKVYGGKDQRREHIVNVSTRSTFDQVSKVCTDEKPVQKKMLEEITANFKRRRFQRTFKTYTF